MTFDLNEQRARDKQHLMEHFYQCGYELDLINPEPGTLEEAWAKWFENEYEEFEREGRRQMGRIFEKITLENMEKKDG